MRRCLPQLEQVAYLITSLKIKPLQEAATAQAGSITQRLSEWGKEVDQQERPKKKVGAAAADKLRLFSHQSTVDYLFSSLIYVQC
jgi:hypothetical protein